MRVLLTYPLIITALAAVVLLPIGGARAETVDEVRKRALAELVQRSSPREGQLNCLRCGMNGSIFCPRCKSAAKPKEIHRVGSISKVKNISCLRGSYLSTVFDFTLRVTGEPDRDISFIIAASYEFDGHGPTPNFRPSWTKPFIKIVSTNGRETVTQLAEQAAFRESGAAMMVAGVNGDGISRSTKSIDMYSLWVNEFTYDMAKEICSETNADKLRAIAKRHKLIE